MVQLVKGGKYVFGWSKVHISGVINLPDEAMDEYQLHSLDRVILMSGSKTSGGFSVVKFDKLLDSPLCVVFDFVPGLLNFTLLNGELVEFRHRFFCWTDITRERNICLPINTLKGYGIKPGDNVLSVRGSGLGVGIIVRGAIIKEALEHPEIKIFD